MADALSTEILSDFASNNSTSSSSQTHDLANFRIEWIPDLIEKLCAKPIRAKDFVSIKFVIGAGFASMLFFFIFHRKYSHEFGFHSHA